MAKIGNSFLRDQYSTADRAVLAFGLARFGAGWRNCRGDRLSVSLCRDFFDFACAAFRTDEGHLTRFGAGGFLRHGALVPGVKNCVIGANAVSRRIERKGVEAGVKAHTVDTDVTHIRIVPDILRATVALRCLAADELTVYRIFKNKAGIFTLGIRQAQIPFVSIQILTVCGHKGRNAINGFDFEHCDILCARGQLAILQRCLCGQHPIRGHAGACGIGEHLRCHDHIVNGTVDGKIAFRRRCGFGIRCLGATHSCRYVVQIAVVHTAALHGKGNARFGIGAYGQRPLRQQSEHYRREDQYG